VDVYNEFKDQLIIESAQEYHAKRGEYLSSSALKVFIKLSAAKYKYKKDNPDNSVKAHFVLGTAFHCLLGEGLEAYEEEFVIGGPTRDGEEVGIVSKTFDRAFKKLWEEEKKNLVTNKVHATAMAMRKAGLKDHDVKKMLKDYVPEGVVRTEIWGLPCQIRIDCFNSATIFGDWKSTADIQWFKSDTIKFGYHLSAAFYQLVFATKFGITDFEQLPFMLVAIESVPPYITSGFELDTDLLREAREIVSDAIYELSQCIENDVWPTGFEGYQTIT